MADLFSEYLHCGLPGGYPNKEIPLGPEMSGEVRKALIEQQAIFLAEAYERLATAPWLAYIAAMKHFGLMQVLQLSVESFSEDEDREAFHALEDHGLQIVDSAQ